MNNSGKYYLVLPLFHSKMISSSKIKWVAAIDKYIDPKGEWGIAKSIGQNQKEHFFVAHRSSKTPYCQKHIENSKNEVLHFIGSISSPNQSFCLICGPKKQKTEEEGIPLEKLREMAGLTYKEPTGFYFKTTDSGRKKLNEIIEWKNKLTEILQTKTVDDVVLTPEESVYSHEQQLGEILKKYKEYFLRHNFDPPGSVGVASELKLLREEAGVFFKGVLATKDVELEKSLLNQIVSLKKKIKSKEKRGQIRYDYKTEQDLQDILKQLQNIIKEGEIEKEGKRLLKLKNVELRSELRKNAFVIGPETIPKGAMQLEKEIKMLRELEKLKRSIGKTEPHDNYDTPGDLSKLIEQYELEIKGNPELLVGLYRIEYLKKLMDDLSNENEEADEQIEAENQKIEEWKQEIEDAKKRIETIELEISKRKEKIEEFDGEITLIEEEEFEDIFQSSPPQTLVDERDRLRFDIGLEGKEEVDTENLAEEVKILETIKNQLNRAGKYLKDLEIPMGYANLNELKWIAKQVNRLAF